MSSASRLRMRPPSSWSCCRRGPTTSSTPARCRRQRAGVDDVVGPRRQQLQEEGGLILSLDALDMAKSLRSAEVDHRQQHQGILGTPPFAGQYRRGVRRPTWKVAGGSVMQCLTVPHHHLSVLGCLSLSNLETGVVISSGEVLMEELLGTGISADLVFALGISLYGQPERAAGGCPGNADCADLTVGEICLVHRPEGNFELPPPLDRVMRHQ